MLVALGSGKDQQLTRLLGRRRRLGGYGVLYFLHVLYGDGRQGGPLTTRHAKEIQEGYGCNDGSFRLLNHG